MIVFDDDVKKDMMAPVFSCFVRFLKQSVAKDSLSPRATRNTESREQCGVLVHVQKTSSAKGHFVHGEVDRYCHWHRHRRETADYLGENESAKKMKKTVHVSFEVEAASRTTRSENDARFAAADRNRVASIELRRTSLRVPGSPLKSLGQQSRSPCRCLIFTRRLLSRDRDRRRNWPRMERRQKVSEAKAKKSVRSALQNKVGRVSRSRDLFLFGLT